MIKMKPLLKESTWADRKFGEPLPTIEDYMSETYNDEDCGDGHAVVSEADDDDKYVSVGWGKYKEKGKEDDENAPSFTKTDSGKYVKAGDDKKGDKGDKPEKEPAGKLGGGDFERDFEDDPDDPTRGDPDDFWDDEEGRAKPPVGWKPTRPSYTPSGEPNTIGVDPDDPDAPAPKGGEPEDKPFGGDTGKDADTDDDPIVYKGIGGVLSSMSADDAKNAPKDSPQYKAWAKKHPHVVGMDKASDLAKKGMEKGKEKRPGGKQAEEDYMKADQMMRKYAGVDIKKAEFWAKQKRIAADKMMGEITINGKKYKPITENIEPTIFNPQEEIKKVWNKIKTRQFDRKWKKEII